jgi:hypothetical protein
MIARAVWAGLLALLVLSPAAMAGARNCAGSDCFEWKAPGPLGDLPLRGVAMFRYMRLHVYSAALYTPPGADWRASPKRLVIRYDRSIRKKDIVRAAEKNLKNRYPEKWETLRGRTDLLNEHYRNVSEDDEYVLTHAPGKGTGLYFNGRLEVTIPGDDFAEAYFGIWLSDRPISDEMRAALLGEKR